ncbi:MAG: outer membrane beta-barrel protein, partial [Gammaproteobacteria bacterium]|nr:outer membrane beta-barrel protein [Gammaproteobacteria bacterium]
GYEFADYWGAEVGIMDFGEAKSGTAKVEIGGIDFVATGTYPINDQFDVFAKVGVYFLDADLTDPLGVSQDTDNSDLTFGIGASYNIDEQFSVRAEWQLFKDVGEQAVTGISDLEYWSVGVVYGF